MRGVSHSAWHMLLSKRRLLLYPTPRPSQVSVALSSCSRPLPTCFFEPCLLLNLLIPSLPHYPHIKVVLIFCSSVGPLLLFIQPFIHDPGDYSWVWSLLSSGTLPCVPLCSVPWQRRDVSSFGLLELGWDGGQQRHSKNLASC